MNNATWVGVDAYPDRFSAEAIVGLLAGEGVPAYIVFSDAVLRAMAARLPRSEAELLDVPGVGPAKLQRYGEAFLEVLREG